MFGFFSPRLPLETGAKVWAERRFRDLCRVPGLSSIRTVDVLLPGSSELPTEYAGTEYCIDQLFGVVCRRMGLDSSEIDLHIDSEENLPEALGVYVAPDDKSDRPQIIYCESLRSEPDRLLATLAHEAAHEVLRRQLPEVYLDDDMELCTDMLPVLYGFGVFMANSTLRETSETISNWYYWSLSKSGYLTSEVFGYSLALFAWVREDDAPTWLSSLRPDAAGSCAAGLKYLRKTSDCVFSRELDERWPPAFNDSQLQSELQLRSKTRQANALIELSSRPLSSANLQSEIVTHLQSSDPDVRLLALETLRAVEKPDEATFFRILEAEHDVDTRVRRLLPSLIRPDSCETEFAVRSLTRLIGDSDPTVASGAAASLAAFAESPGVDNAFPAAVDLLKRLLKSGQDFQIVAVLKLMNGLVDDLATWGEDQFAADDEWLLAFRHYHAMLDS
jgi:hypothetical protein